MRISNKILIVVSILCISFIASASSLDEAKKYIAESRYDEAIEILQKLVKSNPKDISSNLLLGEAYLKKGNQADGVKYLKIAENRGSAEASFALANISYLNYLPDEAQTYLEKAENSLRKSKKTIPNEYKILEGSIRSMVNMLDRVAKVEIIDTIRVDSSKFIDYYRLSSQAGTISYGKDDKSPKLVFMPEMKNEMLWVGVDENGKSVISGADILDDGMIEKPSVLDLGNLGNEAYPFLMSDGATLYFAADEGPEGLGGYDIYFTRKNDDGSFMQSQNIGMPFNSPFNDFMYVIDETTNLGWFASDREQIEGVVTIYIFSPSETRINFSPDSPDLISYAQLDNIEKTQNPEINYKELLNKRLAVVGKRFPANLNTLKFELDLGENLIYTSLDDFHNEDAKRAMLGYLSNLTQIKNLEQKLEGLRFEFSKDPSPGLIEEIINLEGIIESSRQESIKQKNSAIKLEKRSF